MNRSRLCTGSQQPCTGKAANNSSAVKGVDSAPSLALKRAIRRPGPAHAGVRVGPRRDRPRCLQRKQQFTALFTGGEAYGPGPAGLDGPNCSEETAPPPRPATASGLL